ncbi:hypothetical protein CLV96_0490 [Leptospira meyeri]|uniref:Uncharacterized protein n=1 Tax=Leptospira meyeri TaxID=29508 RepID=A0A4R8MUY7_LEPME|nr:hypothetical protein LEP1GSC017_3480 [Leptospira meyeri serovar Hardjo str. Went 5]EMJ86639.1 hypothetical protein LEP1GSC196_3436 [Leptospira meyeri serovar Semaranga str. Veldrot Semarang 173]TDY71527.1 hypothetical protein CLV96_0490 [Leptospira meyeri]
MISSGELNWQGILIMTISLVSVISLTVVCIILLFRNRH